MARNTVGTCYTAVAPVPTEAMIRLHLVLKVFAWAAFGVGTLVGITGIARATCRMQSSKRHRRWDVPSS